MDRISWQTIEYLHTEKNSDWYWIVGIVSISLAVIAIILNNVVFGILIMVSAFTLSLLASRRPSIVDVSIDNIGVTFGKSRYVYKNLESYWIETRDNYPRLLIKSKKVLMPLIVIHIEDEEDNHLIKEVISKHLPEEEHAEPLLEKILIYLGF